MDLKSQQQTGAGFTAHANLGKGSSTENTTTHTNTTVQVAGATHNDIASNFTLDGANIDSIQLNIQNTSKSKQGACYGCGGDNAMGGSIGDFKNLNKNIKIHIEHGSTKTSK